MMGVVLLEIGLEPMDTEEEEAKHSEWRREYLTVCKDASVH